MPVEALYSTEDWLARFGPSRKPVVVTIGNFDGMHRGHQEILRRVTQQARETGSPSAVLTFYPHPARVLRPGHAPSLLETIGQRIEGFGSLGIDAVLVMKFDVELARMSAEDFAQTILADTLRTRDVLVGKNFRFGHRQRGDSDLLVALGQRLGFEVELVEPVAADGSIISSSAIREAVQQGRMEDAARILGRPFTLRGEIKQGTGLGRKLVVPTLNLATEQEALPKEGVYVTETMVCGALYRSVTNVGNRPTFNGATLAIESHLFDFSLQLASGQMEIRFLERLRGEQKFSGPDALREQVLKDIERAKEFHAARSA